jgi:hypothetical protein
VDAPVGVVPGELEVLDVEGGFEGEVLRGGGVGSEGVDGPEPLGTEGTVGVETVGAGAGGVGAVGVGTVGVETVGADTFGVVTVSAEAGGRAAIPITTSVVIAPTSSFRLRNTVVNLLVRVCSSKLSAPRPRATHIESPAPLRSRGGSRSRAPRRRAPPPTGRHLEA